MQYRVLSDDSHITSGTIRFTVAGITMALILAPDWSTATQPSGELLWVKLAAFALLLVRAAANKWRLVPGLVRAVAGAPESGA